MTQKRYLIYQVIFGSVLCSLYLSSCNDEMNQQTKTRYFSKIIAEESSPNGKYKFTLGELGDSTRPFTQLMVHFDDCGGSGYDPKGWNLGIKAHWKGNDTIVVEGKRYNVIVKHDFVQCYLNKVYIKYVFE